MPPSTVEVIPVVTRPMHQGALLQEVAADLLAAHTSLLAPGVTMWPVATADITMLSLMLLPNRATLIR